MAPLVVALSYWLLP